MLKTSLPKFAHDLVAQLGIHQPGDFFRCDFNPGQGVVIADPIDAEALRSQDPLAAPDLAQSFRRDLGPVREAAGQAGQRRLVPDRKSDPARRLPDVRFGEPELVERRTYSPLARRLASRPVVATVVDVEPIEHIRNAEPARVLDGRAVHLGLTEVTTIHRVARVARVVELVGLDEEMTGSELLGQLTRVGPLLIRQTRGHRGERNRRLTKHGNRFGEQEARVDAAGKADDDLLHVLQESPQACHLHVN